VLDALRQPLESGEVVIARSGLTARFPARFTLVLAANPCPCARAAAARSACSCSPAVRRRYLARLSGPLLDRVDVKVEFLPVGRAELLSDRRLTEPTAAVAERVRRARRRAAIRLSGTPWRLNAEIPGSELRKRYLPAASALSPLERAMDLGPPAGGQGDQLCAGPVARSGHMSLASGHERLARAALSFVAEPGDLVLGELLRSRSPAELVAVLSGHGDPRAAGPAGHRGSLAAARAMERWRARLDQIPTPARLAAWERSGIRLVCPGEPEWPTQLDTLGNAAPIVLWLRGASDLRYACLHSVSLVGARASTAYGAHVCTEMAAALAERGFTVVSGGAYGIDACAHRGALAASGLTIAVLASGLSYGYPKGHHELFAAIAARGAVVSECPPDRAPTRPGFLVRNRLIAALSRGTVVVEAALRSGALSTAKHARELCRPLMAVPGPVTSEQSAGCHELIREWGAVCVTGAAQVLEHVCPLGEEPQQQRLGPAVPRDALDEVTTAVLAAVPLRGGRGPATIAALAGADLDTALRCLGLLAAAGHIERCEQGWRARKLG